MLNGNRTLESLRLNTCHIGEDAIINLTRGLKGHPSMRKLDLGCCAAEDNSIRFFSEVFTTNTRLLNLNLSENYKVSEAPFEHMVELMCESPNLKMEKINLAANGNIK